MTALHVVAWLRWWRVVTDLGAVAAVCETFEEAEAYIAQQPEEEMP